MKNKFNPILVISIPVLLVGMLILIFLFNKMNGSLVDLSSSATTPDGFNSFDITFKSAFLGIIIVPIIAIAAIAYALLFSSKNIDQAKIQSELLEQAKTETVETKEELAKVYAELENANSMAERTTLLMNLIQKADNLDTLSSTMITELSRSLDASQGAFFIRTEDSSEKNKDIMKLISSYAYHIPEDQEVIFQIGEGLIGQVAKDGKTLLLKEIPEGHIEIISGLGSSQKAHLVLVPIMSDEKVLGIMEIASFKSLSEEDIQFIEQIAQNISTKLSVMVLNNG